MIVGSLREVPAKFLKCSRNVPEYIKKEGMTYE